MKKIPGCISISFLLSIQFCFAQMEEGAPISVEVKPAMSIPGKPIEISGNTVVGKEALEVSIIITDPGGKEISLNTKTDKKGEYKLTYTKAFSTGKYAVMVKPADGINAASASFAIATITGAVNAIQTDFFKMSQAAQTTLDVIIQKMESLPPSPDIETQTSKLKSYRDKFSSLKASDEKVAQGIKELIKKTQDVPEAALKANEYINQLEANNKKVVDKLPELNSKVQEYKNKSLKCEALNGITEMCGFISLVLDVKASALKIVVNLSSDKVLPGAVDRMNWKGSDQQKEQTKFGINSAQKALVAHYLGSAEMVDFLKKGLSLDICSYVFKFLYAQNCEELKGPASTTFKVTFQADNGENYLVYDLDLKGELKLRYEKSTDLSKSAEITGEFIGYRVRYGFQEDFEQQEKIPDGMTVLARQALTPRAVDLNKFNNDIGSFASSAIPGSYHVAVKGTVLNNKLTLQIVPSAFDMTETEETNRIFLVLLQPLLPIPVIKNFTVPIAKNKTIFIASIPKQQSFSLVKNKTKVTAEIKGLKNELKPGSGVRVNTTFNMNISN